MSEDPRAQTPSQFLVADDAAGDTLRRIGEIARDAIPAAEIAGMSLLTHDGGPATPIDTHEASPAIDRGQYAEGRGRALIEQATGVLMAKDDDLSPNQAFTLLAGSAERQDVTVRVVARGVVEERDPTVADA